MSDIYEIIKIVQTTNELAPVFEKLTGLSANYYTDATMLKEIRRVYKFFSNDRLSNLDKLWKLANSDKK